MDIQAVSASASSTATAAESLTRTVNSELGKDEFMQILVTQLRNQDPLSPMEDKDFISQMAQFSVLEQMQNMNTGSSFAQACALVGKQAYATMVGEDGVSTDVFGTVKSAQTIQGIPYLEVGDKMIPYSTDIIVYAEKTEV